MRSLCLSAMLATTCATAGAPHVAPSIYDPDPEHLWNRLYRLIAVRTDGATDFGADNAEPYGDPFDDPKQLAGVLDEFLRKHAETLARGDLRRALLQNDVWAAFDLSAGPGEGAAEAPVQRGLARVIERLRMKTTQISGLPDNYAQAVASATLATDFDPEQPDRAFLPPDLLDPKGQWVEIGENGAGAVAPFHVLMLSGRSVFRVFIRCPGGRQATLSYLETLNLYPTPWVLNPQDIGTRYPDNAKVRMHPLLFNPATPQFPPGTIVALVRQMMVINDEFKPVATTITQKVQFRVFNSVGEPGHLFDPGEFSARQLVYELVMRRADLLAGKAGGFHYVTPDESEYQLTTVPMGQSGATHLNGVVVLKTCARCHPGNGIFSVKSYGQTFNMTGAHDNPSLLPATSSGYQSSATADWKTAQFNWGLLRGLLDQEAPTRTPNGVVGQYRHQRKHTLTFAHVPAGNQASPSSH